MSICVPNPWPCRSGATANRPSVALGPSMSIRMEPTRRCPYQPPSVMTPSRCRSASSSSSVWVSGGMCGSPYCWASVTNAARRSVSSSPASSTVTERMARSGCVMRTIVSADLRDHYSRTSCPSPHLRLRPLGPDPLLPRPPRHRPRGRRRAGRARREHHGVAAVRRPAVRAVLHAGAGHGRDAARRAARRHSRPVAQRFDMDWSLDVAGRPVRTLVMGSTAAHCLNDLAFRQRSENLPDRPGRRRVQPHGARAARRVLRHPVPPRPGDVRDQGAGRGAAARAGRGARRRAGRAGALHADPVRRPVPAPCRAASSTSTTRSCRRSRARVRTRRRTTGASSSSAPPRTT